MGGTVRRRIIVTSEFKANVTGVNQVNALAKAQKGVTAANKSATSTFGTLRGGLTKARIAYFNIAVLLGTVALATRALIKPSIELETQMANVRKTTGLTAEAAEDLKEGFIDLSKTLPVSAKELAEIGAVAGQLGIKGKQNILGFTSTVALMAIATELTAEQAATSLGKISNVFNIPISKINNLGSVINQLSNDTAANSKEIVASLTRIGAAGASLGITVDFASALSATLIGAGMRAERTGTRVRTALRIITTSMDRVKDSLPNLDIKEFSRLLETDANAAILLLLKSFKELGVSSDELAGKINKAFGSQAGFVVQTLVDNLGDFEKNLEIANLEMRTGISLLRETAIQLETTANQWLILKNNITSAILDNEGPVNRILSGWNVWFINLNLNTERYGTTLGLVKSAMEDVIAIGSLGTLKPAVDRTNKEVMSIIQQLGELQDAEGSFQTTNLIFSIDGVGKRFQVANIALNKAKSFYAALAEEMGNVLDGLDEQNEILPKNSKEWSDAKILIDKVNEAVRLNQEITQEDAKSLKKLSEALSGVKREQTDLIRDKYPNITIAQQAFEEQTKKVNEAIKISIEEFETESDILKILVGDLASLDYDVGNIKSFTQETMKLNEETRKLSGAFDTLSDKDFLRKRGKALAFREKEEAGEETAVISGTKEAKVKTNFEKLDTIREALDTTIEKIEAAKTKVNEFEEEGAAAVLAVTNEFAKDDGLNPELEETNTQLSLVETVMNEITKLDFTSQIDQFGRLADEARRLSDTGIGKELIGLESQRISGGIELRDIEAREVIRLAEIKAKVKLGRIGPFDDFIARPGQPAASFSPDDTIIGVKDPASILNSNNRNITINVNGAQSPSSTASEIRRHIESLA